MAVRFENNSARIKQELNEKTTAWLYEASGELEAQVKRNTKVGTGQLKNSWQYKVNESNGESKIGSQLENAIWEEFGTGIYAVNGDGRSNVPWTYQDDRGEWHKTSGKKPHRALQSAFESLKTALQSRLENILRGMN